MERHDLFQQALELYQPHAGAGWCSTAEGGDGDADKLLVRGVFSAARVARREEVRPGRQHSLDDGPSPSLSIALAFANGRVLVPEFSHPVCFRHLVAPCSSRWFGGQCGSEGDYYD